MRHTAAVVFFVALAAGDSSPMNVTCPVASAQVTTIDYDTYGKMDLQGRLKAFNEVSAENKAELVKTQAKRWLEKNRNRLTAEQISVLEENIAFITPDIYRQPKRDEDMKRAKELEAKAASVLSREDMMQALTIYADYIPLKENMNR